MLHRLPEWVETAIRLEREIMGLTPARGGKPEPVHYEIVFTQDFEGLQAEERGKTWLQRNIVLNHLAETVAELTKRFVKLPVGFLWPPKPHQNCGVQFMLALFLF